MSQDLTQEQRLKLLELLNSMGVRDVWFAAAIAQRLGAYGIQCSVDASGTLLLLDSERVPSVRLGWGEPGIHAPDLLRAVLKIHGLDLRTEMTGEGFQFRDFLTQLAMHWQIDRDFT